MASGWWIDHIELPEAPNTDELKISRQFQTHTLFNFFPELTKSQSTSFDYTISGYIYPKVNVFALEQIARSADTNTVILTIPFSESITDLDLDHQRIHERVDTPHIPSGPRTSDRKFAVKGISLSRKGPLFTEYTVNQRGAKPEVVEVVQYSITFTELPNEGEFQEGVDVYNDADEGAIGTSDIEQIYEYYGDDQGIEAFGPDGEVIRLLTLNAGVTVAV